MTHEGRYGINQRNQNPSLSLSLSLSLSIADIEPSPDYTAFGLPQTHEVR